MDSRLDQWNDDGGAAAPLRLLNGSVAQVEWAERIRLRVNSEFDRVAAAFEAVATKQNPVSRASTEAVMAILEDTRNDVMANGSAAYFIHDWQDIYDQVRQMIFSDPRYKALKDTRK